MDIIHVHAPRPIQVIKVPMVGPQGPPGEGVQQLYPEAVIILGGATPPSQDEIDNLVGSGFRAENILYTPT